ncbi:MAG: hypothetical protein HDQ99_07490 [Lachnospiraceae bacterium]|nr:hypothetical protein [Lachnospiraceae bacterium]
MEGITTGGEWGGAVAGRLVKKGKELAGILEAEVEGGEGYYNFDFEKYVVIYVNNF